MRSHPRSSWPRRCSPSSSCSPGSTRCSTSEGTFRGSRATSRSRRCAGR
ncbi:MAG: hypothetical protein EBU70_10555 [Actinobacteria bacterium]|nr:hypothetical protein [Actinomycetota bacterium]